MQIYVIVDALSDRVPDPLSGTVIKVVFDGEVLPVFTSVVLLRNFIKAYFWEGGPVQPVAFALDPLKLANIVSQLEETRGLRYLVFNPSAVCDGRWSEPQIPIPAQSYLRYIAGMMDSAGGTFAEAKAKLDDHFSGSKGRVKLLAWCATQEEEVIVNARARHEELVIEDDPWSDEPDFPTRW